MGLWLLGVIGLVLVAGVGFVLYVTQMPGRSHSGALPALTAAETTTRDRLRDHLRVLAGDIGERHVDRYEALCAAANYIEVELSALGYEPRSHSFETRGRPVRNLEVEIRGHARPDEIMVVGGHYDTVPGCPGANDNGSGAAGVLELARLLRDRRPARTIRLVAFVNEEAPYFQTESMGSLVYARRAREAGDDIVAMISVETIGCYLDAPGSQKYPFPFGYVYPDRGDFIAFVGNLGSRSLVRDAVKRFRGTTRFPSEGTAAPGGLPGIGWSDHWSFWQVGYPAIMVTDTALFRYREYHRPDDTPDRIDYGRMARVVVGLAELIAGLADGG